MLTTDEYFEGLKRETVNYMTSINRFRNGIIEKLLLDEKIKNIWQELDRMQTIPKPKVISFSEALREFVIKNIISVIVDKAIINLIMKNASAALLIQSKSRAEEMANSTVHPDHHLIPIHIKGSSSTDYSYHRNEVIKKLRNGINTSLINYKEITLKIASEKITVKAPEVGSQILLKEALDYASEVMAGISNAVIASQVKFMNEPKNAQTLAGIYYDKFEELSKVIERLTDLNTQNKNTKAREIQETGDYFWIQNRCLELHEEDNFTELTLKSSIKNHFNILFFSYYKYIMFLGDVIFSCNYTNLATNKFHEYDRSDLIKKYKIVTRRLMIMTDFDWDIAMTFFNETMDNVRYLGSHALRQYNLSIPLEYARDANRTISFKVVKRESEFEAGTYLLWMTLHQSITLWSDTLNVDPTSDNFSPDQLTPKKLFSIESYCLLGYFDYDVLDSLEIRDFIKDILTKSKPKNDWDIIPNSSQLQIKTNHSSNESNVPIYFSVISTASSVKPIYFKD